MTHRNSLALRLYRKRVQSALDTDHGVGMHIMVSRKMLEDAVEICDQAIHTEKNHEQPDDREV